MAQQPRNGFLDEHQGSTSPEPRDEQQKDARVAREHVASEPDSGRQLIDRSRPSSFVRKTH